MQSGLSVDVGISRTKGPRSCQIQLQSICLHPRCNLVDADGNPLSEIASVRRLTMSIDLGVVCISIRRDMMTLHKLQQVGSVQEKQDQSKDRALRDSKVDCRWYRTGRRCANLCLAAEVRHEPVVDLPAKAVRRAQSMQERMMVDAVRSRRQVTQTHSTKEFL